MPIVRDPLPGLLIEHGSDSTRPLSAFLMGSNHKRMMVIVGGQLDGYFSLPFMRPLAKELDAKEWATCLTKFGSSYLGSRDSHVQDATDLKGLLDLLQQQYEAAEVCLFGWDTGVQVVLEYLSAFKLTDIVTRVILNGAVIDPLSETSCGVGALRRKEYVEKAITERRRNELAPIPSIYDKDITIGRLSCGGYPTLQEAVWVPARSGDVAALRDALSSVRTPLLIQALPGPGYRVSQKERADVDHFVSSNAASTEVYLDFIDNSADERRDILQGTEKAHVKSVLNFLESADRRRIERVDEQRAINYDSERRQRSVLHNSELAYSKE